VVFSGYNQAPSIKDINHLKWKGSRPYPHINFNRKTVCSTKKEVFLSNSKNKQAIIAMTSEYLTKAGCQVYQVEGNADFPIVLIAVRSASFVTTILVGDGRDMLILLCYHTQTGSQAIYFYSEPRAGIPKNRTWDINATKLKFGSRIFSTILYVHAFLGCDSISRIYGIGKSAGLQLLIKNNEFNESTKVFIDPLQKKRHEMHLGLWT
jgi:5'-3' exonuclease